MLTKTLHDNFVYSRRMEILSDSICKLIPDKVKILDVGCGDGKIDFLMMKKKKVSIEGVDVLVRDKTFIPVRKYDGETLPYDDDSFDYIFFIDVLHHIESTDMHTYAPIGILKEAKRVANKGLIIKDHICKGLFAYSTLKFMDYVGNAHYGVRLSYNYLKENEWNECFETAQLKVEEFNGSLKLYPFPFNLLFDRKLHFIAKLSVQ